MARAKGGSPAVRTSYDRPKEFQGKRYTGMAVGRGHKWKYDSGDWTEKKVTPDKWEIHYAVKKHRKGGGARGVGRAGRHLAPLVHPGRPSGDQARCEHLLHRVEGNQVQARSPTR